MLTDKAEKLLSTAEAGADRLTDSAEEHWSAEEGVGALRRTAEELRCSAAITQIPQLAEPSKK